MAFSVKDSKVFPQLTSCSACGPENSFYRFLQKTNLFDYWHKQHDNLDTCCKWNKGFNKSKGSDWPAQWVYGTGLLLLSKISRLSVYEPLFTPADNTHPPKGRNPTEGRNYLCLKQCTIVERWLLQKPLCRLWTHHSFSSCEGGITGIPPECCKQQGFDIIFPSEPVTYISPKSVRLLDIWGPFYHFMWAGGLWQKSLTSPEALSRGSSAALGNL